jgi:hypothetical protein
VAYKNKQYCVHIAYSYVSHDNYSFFDKEELEIHYQECSHGGIVEVFDTILDKTVKLKVRKVALDLV